MAKTICLYSLNSLVRKLKELGLVDNVNEAISKLLFYAKNFNLELYKIDKQNCIKDVDLYYLLMYDCLVINDERLKELILAILVSTEIKNDTHKLRVQLLEEYNMTFFPRSYIIIAQEEIEKITVQFKIL
jgi:hypothetical protein